MYKTQRNLMIVSAFFIAALIISNILAAKVVQIGFIEIPAAVIAYPVTFLCIDIISELWGKKEAQFLVRVGLVVQIVTLILIYIAIALPPAPYTNQEAFAGTLGTQWGIVLASLLAYLASQSFDVFAFHKIRERFKPKWARNSTTIVSQLIDTTIFITIAGLLVWGTPIETILVMIACQYAVKVLFALADTPFFYLLTRHGQAASPEEYERMKAQK